MKDVESNENSKQESELETHCNSIATQSLVRTMNFNDLSAKQKEIYISQIHFDFKCKKNLRI